MRKLFFVLFIGVLISSCLNETNIPNIGERLTTVSFNDTKLYEYEYDADGFLVAEKAKFHYYGYFYSVNSGVVSKKIYFDSRILSSNSGTVQEANNRSEWVNPQNTTLSGTLVYEFDSNNRLVKSTELNGHSEYEYDNNGRISTRKMFNGENLTGIREYKYDMNGNVSTDSHYYILEDGSKLLSNTTEYEFDSKKNPYQYLRPDRAPGENTNPNNVTREKYSVINYPSSMRDIRYTYIYNDSGYPIERNDGQRYQYSN
ncbi:YD repeat-containing protein [Aquiflexum balticum DSM 16537]|uniref:YD repeat-containing protein n=1 Tax=Aquiflexum balticum DSM 16537 TaxID=758820 RepID=A0A1W2H0V9_9BACT|nr:hypothetical protein [Aquiflexum balticum]SMD42587.1 YD repeat-containing protein [Aquiflexum balticum DSM 16537]